MDTHVHGFHRHFQDPIHSHVLFNRLGQYFHVLCCTRIPISSYISSSRCFILSNLTHSLSLQLFTADTETSRERGGGGGGGGVFDEASACRPLVMDRGWKPNVEVSPSCPRCGSSNTKFCYYNNYSLTQPRYFCKGCRRYWTKGGSLRNVPVGGGCRKSRRGKSVRLSADHGASSKRLPYGGMPNYDPINKVSSLVEPTSSSIMADGSHIDLALVYANFLNQQPDSKPGLEMPEFPGEFDPSLEFPSMANINNSDSSSVRLKEEDGLAGCLILSDLSPLSESDNIFYAGLNLVQKHDDRAHDYFGHETRNHGLPPLPGEEMASQDTLSWPNPHVMENHTMQPTQEPVLHPEAQDPNLLFGNWSPFDLPIDDTFSRT